ncbi:MAG: MotA/TolQ/ExbB proton channel family protein [Phycisphaeraceae bacterium]|nr:MotA/TolQ/ExbB proton channel family protein [Phycisphaeraceae bacterium]
MPFAIPAVTASMPSFLAQLDAPSSQGAAASEATSIWSLFMQSFDLFTILIVMGSVFAVAIIVRAILTLRRSVILPAESIDAVQSAINERRWADLQQFVGEDDSFVSRVLRESLPKLRVNPLGIHEATEMAADTETARRFKEVEWLGVIGNLGPLLGLVGTVWGMIIAFTAIGETGGQAAASQLSIGIAKALFHTFLGLLLAIPALLAYGMFRERLDRICSEGTMLATDAMDQIAAVALQNPGAQASPAQGPGAAQSPQPRHGAGN